MSGKKGMKMPLSHRVNTSKAMLGNKHQEKKRSDTTKRKIAKALKGNKHTFKYKHSSEMKLNCRIAKVGKKNPAWQGGISFEPYSPEWKKEVKEKIKERDLWTCQIC